MLLLTATALGVCWPAARAQAPVLRWSAPPSCPTERELLEQIATRLRGRTLERQAVLAEGSILLSHGRYFLTLKLASDGQLATRALSASRCSALADTASWLVAVALAPDLAEPTGETVTLAEAHATRSAAPSRDTDTLSTTSAAAHAASGARAPQAVDAPRTRAVPAEVKPQRLLRTTKLKFVSVRKRKRWLDDEDRTEQTMSRGDARRGLYASMFSGVFSAGLPAPVSSLGMRLGMDFDSFSVQLRGAHMMARTREAGAVRVRFPMQELGAAGCMAWGERVRGGPCATLSLMRTAGFIDGASEPRRSVVYWATAGVSAYLSWLVQRPFELSAETGLGLPISARPRFVLDEFGQLERASALSLYARLGVGVRYP